MKNSYLFLAFLGLSVAVSSCGKKDETGGRELTPVELKQQNDSNKQQTIDQILSKDRSFKVPQSEAADSSLQITALNLGIDGNYKLLGKQEGEEFVLEGKCKKISDSDQMIDLSCEREMTIIFLRPTNSNNILCARIQAQKAATTLNISSPTLICESADQQ